MSEIHYDPACMTCRKEAGKSLAGTTWDCNAHILAERDRLRLALETATRELDEIRATGGTSLSRLIAAERERDEAREKLEKSRRTLVISCRDVLACTENLSVPSDVKGDNLHDVVLSLLQDRADVRAERDALLSRPAPPADAATEAYAAFGRALLPLWWDDGNPGDIDGGDVQDAAEKAGLWHHVERHAPGVECDWCNNEEPCGELTEAGLALVSTPAPAPSAKEGRT